MVEQQLFKPFWSSALRRLHTPNHAVSGRCEKFKMTGSASFRPDLPIQVPPELPSENHRKVRLLPMLAISLARNFLLVFLAVQERLIPSLCFWGILATVLAAVAREIDGKSSAPNVSIIIVEL